MTAARSADLKEDPPRQWQAGDRVAMQKAGEAGWLVIPADQAREKLGITEATPGWTFVEVVADCDTPG